MNSPLAQQHELILMEFNSNNPTLNDLIISSQTVKGINILDTSIISEESIFKPTSNDLFHVLAIDEIASSGRNQLRESLLGKSVEKIWAKVLCQIFIVWIPFAYAFFFLYESVQKKNFQKYSYIVRTLKLIYDFACNCMLHLPFVLLIQEGGPYDSLCLLLLYLVFFEVYMIINAIETFEKRSLARVELRSKYKRARHIMKAKLLGQHKTIIDYSNDQTILYMVILGFYETRYLEILPSNFKFYVMKGDEENYDKLLAPIKNRYSELIKMNFSIEDLDKPEHNMKDGFYLLLMVLTRSYPVPRGLQFSLILFLLFFRIAAIIIPLFTFNDYYDKLLMSHSLLYDISQLISMIIFYGIIPTSVFAWIIGRGNVRGYYNQLKWAGQLININTEKEKQFDEDNEEKNKFKLDIFDENTLESWLISVISMRKAWTKEISFEEKKLIGFLVYLAIFIIFFLSAFFLEIDQNSYFAYGYLFMLLPVDTFSILIPILIYLYYGHKVNDSSEKIIDIIDDLILLYENLKDAAESDRLNELNRCNINRYNYLWMCLNVKFGLTSKNSTQVKKAVLEKLEYLRKKAKSIRNRYQKEVETNSYQFLGVIDCTPTKYKAILIAIVGINWSAIVGYAGNFI